MKRRSLGLVSILVTPVLVFACGGGAQKDAMHPDPVGSGSAGTGAGAEPSSPTTTTDVSTASTGTKLQPAAGSGASSTGTATGPRSAGEPGRSLADIQVIITSRREEARACYDAAQKLAPTLEGDVKLTWVIDPKGVVTESGVVPAGSTMFDPAMNTCLEGFVKKIKFNESGKGLETRAAYTFNFHPKQFVKKP
jgi:outer membrane biosynthesis protein TonB